MARGPNSLQMLKSSAPSLRGPGETEASNAHVHTCRHTHVHTQFTGGHMPPDAYSSRISLLRLDLGSSLFYFCSVWELNYRAQRAPSRAGQVARSTSSGFGPWRAAPSVSSSVWASRRALYLRSRASRGGGALGWRMGSHLEKDQRGLGLFQDAASFCRRAHCLLLSTPWPDQHSVHRRG